MYRILLGCVHGFGLFVFFSPKNVNLCFLLWLFCFSPLLLMYLMYPQLRPWQGTAAVPLEYNRTPPCCLLGHKFSDPQVFDLGCLLRAKNSMQIRFFLLLQWFWFCSWIKLTSPEARGLPALLRLWPKCGISIQPVRIAGFGFVFLKYPLRLHVKQSWNSFQLGRLLLAMHMQSLGFCRALCEQKLLFNGKQLSALFPAAMVALW